MFYGDYTACRRHGDFKNGRLSEDLSPKSGQTEKVVNE